MIDPELRDIKCEWIRLPGAPDWMRHLRVTQVHGDNSETTIDLTEKQAALVAEVYNERTKIS